MSHNPGQIGQYRIEKELGEGTFGQVKLGIHIPTGEKVAVKILEKDKILDQSDVERVSREIQILKLIRHPNIIQLYEIIEDKTHLYLIMEFAEGGELFEYIVQKKKLKEEEACKFFQQIVAGVEYIHKLKIVHRDLKPENLLLDKQGGIKIVDFGLSNKYQTNQLLKTACGSPCYAAPEMIAGKQYEGLKVDIWSCGVILFAMVCGYLPFDEDKTQDLYQKIIDGDYSIPSHVSTYGRDLITRILTTNPDKRITINEIRKHPWYSIYSSQHEPRGIIVGYNRIPIDPYILELLPKYGQKQDAVVRYLENNKHNKSTTLYYLLLLQHVKSGHDSPHYIGSTKFRPALLQEDADEAEKERLRKEKQAEERQKLQDVEAKRRKEIEDLKNFKKTMENQIPQLLVPVIQEVNPRRHREATRGQERGAVTHRGTSAVPQFFNEQTERDPELPKPEKEINEENKDRYASRSRTRKTPYQNPEEIKPLPSSVINYHHNRIAERTKKPNLAQLNNTTVISFDDRSASPIKGRRESEIYNQRGQETEREAQTSRRRDEGSLNPGNEAHYQKYERVQAEQNKNWPPQPTESTPKNYPAPVETNRSASRGQQQTDRHIYRDSNNEYGKLRQSNDFALPQNNHQNTHSPNLKAMINQQIVMTDRSHRQEVEQVQVKGAQTERETRRNDVRENRGRNLTEMDQNYLNSFADREEEAPNTKRTMGASTDRYIQKTGTAEKPKAGPEDKENQGVTDGMKIHKGPLNLSSVSMKNPLSLMQDILEVVEMLDIKYRPTSKYAAKCEKGSLKFLVEVNFVENFKNMYAIKFYKSTGDSLKYAHLCNCIFQRLNLQSATAMAEDGTSSRHTRPIQVHRKFSAGMLSKRHSSQASGIFGVTNSIINF